MENKRAWASRAPSNGKWIRSILSPHLPGATQEELDILFQKETHPKNITAAAPPAPAAVPADVPAAEHDFTADSLFSVRSSAAPLKGYSSNPLLPARASAEGDYTAESLLSGRLSGEHDYTANSMFSSRSIEVSESPMVRPRPFQRASRYTILDEIREREIETLTARAVASTRLEEMKERDSEERSFRRFAESPTPAPRRSKTPEVMITTNENGYESDNQSVLEEDGYPIIGAPVWIMPEESYKAKSPRDAYPADTTVSPQAIRRLANSVGSLKTSIEEYKEEDEEFMDDIMEIIEEEDEDRNQPHSTKEVEHADDGSDVYSEEESSINPIALRTIDALSKLSSEDLTDARSVEDILRTDLPEGMRSPYKYEDKPISGTGLLTVDENLKRRSTDSSPPKSDVDPEERITAEAKLFELQDNKSERVSWSAPSRSRSASPIEDHEQTPKAVKADPLSLPTPRVTGAYVETPAPSERHPSSLPPGPTPRVIGAYIETPAPTERLSGKQRYTSLLDNDNVKSGRSPSRGSSGSQSGLEDDNRSQTTSTQNTIHETKNKKTPYQTPPFDEDSDTGSSDRSSRRSSGDERRRRRDSPHPKGVRKHFPLINTAIRYDPAEEVRLLELAAGLEDDTTLDNFAAMLEEAEANPSPTTLEFMDALIKGKAGRPLSKKEQEQRLEEIRIQNMAKRLDRTSTGIREAKQGIGRIEHQVSALVDGPLPKNSKRTHRPDGDPTKPHHTSALPIKPSIKFYVETENFSMDLKMNLNWPTLWTTFDDAPARGRFGGVLASHKKLTWFGLLAFFFLLFSSWFLAESTMCSLFCKPTYSTTNSNWDYNAPSFPYALPTKVDQWTGSFVSTGLTNTYGYLGDLFNSGTDRAHNHSAKMAHYKGGSWWMDGDGPVVGIQMPEASTFDDDEII